MPLYVPEDCKTLKEAVARVEQDPRITTIVLGEGEHVVEMFEELGQDCNHVKINSAMQIVGRPDVPKEKIVVVGGIEFKRGIQGDSHLQHMTLRQAKRYGVVVVGHSSFTMEDVLVEQCAWSGVVAAGVGAVGRCTNVEVRQCGMSGVLTHSGGSITLIGAKTMVHHNCTSGNSWDFGLTVFGSSSSTIHLVSPLTKEQVSLDNGGGGNWGSDDDGDINQIKTIDAPAISSSSSSVQTGEAKSIH